MSDGTHIEWTDATWNPVTGCSVVSPGCTNCYAMKLAGTRLAHHPSRAGLTVDSKAGPVWNGQVRLNLQWLEQPLRWRRPRRVFVCAHGDLFHESVPDDWIDKVFAAMALSPQHQFQVLTKRAGRMRAYLTRLCESDGAIEAICDAAVSITASPCAAHVEDCTLPLPNVWLGVSAEDQQRADERIPELLATPAAVRFLSAEPLLGPIDLHEVIPDPLAWSFAHGFNGLDWLIVGGESGKGARPMHPDWARTLRDQCTAAGVAFFFKQWGEWGPSGDFGTDASALAHYRGEMWRMENSDPEIDAPLGLSFMAWPTADRATGDWLQRLGKARAGRALDGREWSELPTTQEAPHV